jgi:hypothetical protein
MASKSKIARQGQAKQDKKVNFYLIAIPVLAFVIKLITMANTPNGGWLGADGRITFQALMDLLQKVISLRRASSLTGQLVIPFFSGSLQRFQ